MSRPGSPLRAPPSGEALLAQLDALPFDARDAYVDELFGLGEIPADGPDLPRGAVPYLPCGVDELLTVVREAPVGAEDVLVDLGSGVGRALFLAQLLSGARAIGVEIQAALAERSREIARSLGLERVEIVHGDAATLLPVGTVYLLYATFQGATLARVLRAIEERGAPVKICAVSCELPGQRWLRARETSSPAVVIYERPANG